MHTSELQPLQGFTVLEISTKPSGMYSGWMLRELGATVFRLDLPLVADCAPELLPELNLALNAGKKFVEENDENAVNALVDSADLLLIDSRHDDALDGLAVRTTLRVLSRIPATLPVLDISGHRTSTDEVNPTPAAPIMQSAAAGMSWAIGRPGEPPLTLPFDLPDYLAGTEAAAAASLALLLKTTGFESSQSWDISASDVLATYVGHIGANFVPYERPWQRSGSGTSMSGGAYPAAMFRCQDGFISIMCRTPREWKALVAAMGNPDWSKDPRFQDNRIVAKNYSDEADSHLVPWLLQLTCDEVFRLGQEYSFPVAPVLSVKESLDLPHFHDRGFTKPTYNNGSKVTRPWQLSARDEPPIGPIDPTRLRERRAPSVSKPLKGLRVLDMSWVWSGPMVSATLSDLGAEVIKVENRKRADPARLRGPAVREGVPVEGPELETSPYFNQMNRGKQSIGVDISTPEGRDIILDLAARSDIVLENMRPGAMERRGLSYEELSAKNPSLVMLSMSVMGQTGPMRSVGGYAPVMTGLAGLDSLVGYQTGDLIGLWNPALGDPIGAAHATAVLFAALVRQAQTGEGCWIDLAQVEAVANILRAPHIESHHNSKVRVMGNQHSTWRPHGTWPCQDGQWLAVTARTDHERSELARLLDTQRPTDEQLTSDLEQWLAKKPGREAVTHLQAAGIPAHLVWSYEQMSSSNWARSRKLGHHVTHPHLGEQMLFSVSWKLNRTPFKPAAAAPALGEDTTATLTEVLGISEEDIRNLAHNEIIDIGENERSLVHTQERDSFSI